SQPAFCGDQVGTRRSIFIYKKMIAGDARYLTINAGGRLLDLSIQKVKGILNVTPDSIYDGGRHNTVHTALIQAERMLSAGADLLDIGAYSTRPKATVISITEELDRLIPVITAIAKAFPDALLSVDTFRSEVARRAVETGAHVINDISGGTFDEAMRSAERRVGKECRARRCTA